MSTNHTRLSPRQKMINLMYIVLTAMLALNVSSDVLDGFTEVEKGVETSNENMQSRNQDILRRLEALNLNYPEKRGTYYKDALTTSRAADSLCGVIDSLKYLIIKASDGSFTSIEDMEIREDTEAAASVMLSPLEQRGKELRKGIDGYRQWLISLIGADNLKKKLILNALETDSKDETMVMSQSWEEKKFENKPAIAAITLLSQLQNDIRYTEGETLSALLEKVDATDVRVNRMEAFVLPRSRMVMQGSEYQAEILLAAVDSTRKPIITVEGMTLSQGNNLYKVKASGSGEVRFGGTVEVPHPDGTFSSHEFTATYNVIEPIATVSAMMMNVLYAGIDNPLGISIPGIPSNAVSAKMSNGELSRTAAGWIARPSKPGTDCVIEVSADIDGHRTKVAESRFRVRRLPAPTPYINLKSRDGELEKHRGGQPVFKSDILKAEGVGAAIDDEALDIPFKVNGFETVFFDAMGNAMVEISDGSRFSKRQIDAIKRMSRGKRFYISAIKATGPDGITRELSPLEIKIK